MLLKYITLYNYGPYFGRHRFNFATVPPKPMVLIGGLNGGGKTTLFESVRLCLYGKYHTRISKKQYENKLNDLIHRTSDKRLSNTEMQTSVTVEFLLHIGGHVTEFLVERRWYPTRGRIHEELHIKKRDRNQSEFSDLNIIEKDQWQSFVNGLIPPGISDLFFFDGEKVVKMTQKYDIKPSLNSLLGIDIVEQLNTDLITNLKRNLKGDDKHLVDEFDKLNKQKDAAEHTVERLQESRARKNTEINRIQTQIQDTNAILENMGGGFAKKRHDIETRLEIKRTKLNALSNRIAEMCSSDLPFSLIPDEINDIQNQIDTDRKISQERTKNDIVRDIRHIVSDAINSAKSLNQIKKPHKDKIISEIFQSIKKSMPETQNMPQNETFGFSITQQERIRTIIQNASGPMIQAAHDISSEYATTKEEVVSLEGALASAPADDEIGPIVSKIGTLNKELGQLESEIDTIDNSISSEEALIKHITSKIRRVRAGQYKNKANRRRAKLTEMVMESLDMYAQKLLNKKITLLESYITKAVNELMHKHDFIKSVKINPDTFEVTLYDANGDPIPAQTISQGERQMLSMATLWGLARTSGRPLPFMIDTPLARLDAEHRTKLVERFFPEASHQIILFSTDTEIGPDEYTSLHPYISESYTIQYDADNRQTRVKTGYFWEAA